jgi:hypothetical protein
MVMLALVFFFFKRKDSLVSVSLDCNWDLYAGDSKNFINIIIRTYMGSNYAELQ